MNIQVDPTSSNLASAMLNSKIRPRAVVGYGVKIFHPSPPNYVTRSPGDDIFLSYKMVVEFFFDSLVIIFVGAIIKGKACKDIFGLATQSVK